MHFHVQRAQKLGAEHILVGKMEGGHSSALWMVMCLLLILYHGPAWFISMGLG